jgi:hypothetical protein
MTDLLSHEICGSGSSPLPEMPLDIVADQTTAAARAYAAI